MPKVAVLDYGIGNLHSAHKGFLSAGADARLTANRADIEAADGVVLPGVGAFGATMTALKRSGVAELALKSVAAGQPFLGICVGMQVLYETSAEAPGVAGLAILNGGIELLSADVKRPQMQWNRLNVTAADHPMMAGLDQRWFYFVHSYAAQDSEHTVATADYGGPVVAAAAAGNVWATQFHPEKSSTAGMALLTNFVDELKRNA